MTKGPKPCAECGEPAKDRLCRPCVWDEEHAPSPEEIRLACEEIQASWSERERERRSRPERPVDIKVVTSMVGEPQE